jgi:hypothetical protein
MRASKNGLGTNTSLVYPPFPLIPMPSITVFAVPCTKDHPNGQALGRTPRRHTTAHGAARIPKR